MTIRRLHYLSAIIISIFIGFHLVNHTYSVIGATSHISLMEILRLFYRNIFIEAILLIAIFVQIISGLKLFRVSHKSALTNFEKLHIWSGLYLALFFLIHLSVIFVGRLLLSLDTNFYFGVAGLNTFPFNLFFIPYYGLAIFSFFGHIAAIHNKKMQKSFLGLSAVIQAKAILFFGFFLIIIIFYGLTIHFTGVLIPCEYNILIGK